MKFIGKLLLWLAVAALLAIVLIYFMLQTRWGARQLSGLIPESSGYRLSFDRMEHHFSSASRVELINVTFGRSGRPPVLAAKQVDIGLSSRQITDPLHADTLTLRDGTLNLSPDSAALPFRADALRLSNMAIRSPESGWDLSAQRVTGGVAPWQPEAGNVLGRQAQVQMSAGSMTLNGVAMSNVLVQGEIRDGVASLTTVGADIARGSLTGSAKRGADGSWQIGNLRLSDVRLQSDKSLSDFFAPLAQVPSLAIDRLEVTDASLQGPDWAVTDLDLSLRNLTLSKGGWQSEDGRLSMNANQFIYGSLNLLDPIINAEFSPQGITLRQFTSRWERGMVRTSGRWLREGSALQLDDLAVAGLEYTLPENWRQLAQDPLPGWLQSVTLGRFSASRNLLIDVDASFPWQITSLEGYGDNLQLAQDGRWGIWRGTMSLNGAAATFNRVDVRRPSLKLAANASTINVTDLSAFVQRGLLQTTAVISQLPQRQTTISLSGRGVPLNTLQAWGWPVLNLSGEGNLQLRASASLQPGTPLKPTVNGELHAVNAAGQQATQVVSGGEAGASQAPR